MAWHRGVVIKSEADLAAMRKAGRVNALALAGAGLAVRTGGSTGEGNATAEDVLRKNGAGMAFLGYPGPYPYPAATCISVNDELVHGIPGPRRLQEGDIVSIDCGSVVDGFVGDSAITIGVGKVSEEAQRLLDVTCAALFAGIQYMRAGGRTGDVSAAIQALVERNAFHVVRESPGHGVGRAMHEDPQVPNYGKAGTGMALRPGMTIALEPMV